MQAVSHMNVETPTKSSGNTDKGLMKKLKEFDGLAMSLGNGNIENAERAGQMSQRLVKQFSFSVYFSQF